MKPGIPRTFQPAALLAGLALGFLALPGAAANLIIDDFSTSQGELNVSPFLGPQEDGSSAAGSGIIGGERDLLLSTDPGASVFSSSAEVGGGVAQLADNSQFSSSLLFEWDGADGDPDALDTAGLGGVDLTFGGNNAFEIGLVFDDLPATLNMSLYSTGGGMSDVTFPGAPGTGLIFTDISIFVPFALFNGNVDFADIGAIQLAITSPTNGLDISLDFVQTSIAPIPVPGAMWFFGSALLGMVAMRRREA